MYKVTSGCKVSIHSLETYYSHSIAIYIMSKNSSNFKQLVDVTLIPSADAIATTVMESCDHSVVQTVRNTDFPI